MGKKLFLSVKLCIFVIKYTFLMNFFDKNISLLPYNTFGVSFCAKFFATFSTNCQLLDLINECKAAKCEWWVLGGGSNILFTTKYQGAVIHPISTNIEQNGELTIADAGVEWDDFVEWAVQNGLSGVENLSYIPGSVGACPVQNIGAYGAQVSDVIKWVEYLDTDTMEFKTIEGTSCEFGYRESIFKGSLRGRAIITRVAFGLKSDFDAAEAKLDYGDVRSVVEAMEGGATLRNIREAVTSIRKSKLPEPSEIGNAGSFFKNPVVNAEKFEELRSKYPDIPSYSAPDGVKIPAGWLIDRAGFKGYREGAVGVHEKQALVLVNYGGGTAEEILGLATKIITTIEERYGVTISMEVNIL